MKLSVEQLDRRNGEPLPRYIFIFGDEPLLVLEAADKVRRYCMDELQCEREVHRVEAGFDWQAFNYSGGSLSLFSQRRLIELKLDTLKLGDAGSKAIERYFEHNDEDQFLLVIAGKVDKSTQRTKWFKLLEKNAGLVQVWPVESRQLPQWINGRLASRGLKASRDAVAVLVERVEGNLLAAAQEVEKLHLLYGEGELSDEQVVAAVTDSARYDIFTLVDTALAGQTGKLAKMSAAVKSEGVEPILLLWALAKEIRALESMAEAQQRGKNINQILNDARVWPRRRPLIEKALKRHALPVWGKMLQQASRIDLMIKGLQGGNVWDELLQLSLWLAAKQVVMASDRDSR